MTKRIIINGENAIFGRLCSFAAKKALEGNEVLIVNSEKVIITGSKKAVVKKYGERRRRGGHSQKGPKYSIVPFMMLSRGIRGMLPDFRKGIGKEALKRVKCYNDIPKELENEKMIKIEAPKKLKYIELKELSEKI